MIALSPESRAELRTLKQTYAGLWAAIVELDQQRAALKARKERLRNDFGFRESWLGGRLGGNRNLVKDYWRCISELDRTRTQRFEYFERAQQHQAQIDTTLHSLLLVQDSAYSALQKRLGHGQYALMAVGELLRVICELVDDIDNEQSSMRGLGIAVIHVPVPLGSGDLDAVLVRAVRAALDAYNRAIDKFAPPTHQGFITDARARFYIDASANKIFGDDTCDLDYDELTDIEEQLDLLKQQIEAAQTNLNQAFSQLNQQLRALRTEALASV